MKIFKLKVYTTLLHLCVCVCLPSPHSLWSHVTAMSRAACGNVYLQFKNFPETAKQAKR